MKYGYIRVSTDQQSLDRQIDSLSQYNLDHIFKDKKSGKDFNRQGYQQLKSVLKQGDELYIHALDRLGRNKDLVKSEWAWFKEHGIILRVLNIPTTLISIDTQEWILDMINNIILEVLGALAEQERAELIQRTKEGLEATKKRGTKLGRPRKDSQTLQTIHKQVLKGCSINSLCKQYNISRQTYYNYTKSLEP